MPGRRPLRRVVYALAFISWSAAACGGDPPAAPVTIADDPAAPSQSRVHWASESSMSFDVVPADALPAGVFRATWVKPVIPYAGIGPRLLLARSSVHDDGAPMISKTTERSTRIGVGIPLGVELSLGPGSAVGELLLQYGTLNHVATGDAHTGALTLGLGYRMWL